MSLSALKGKIRLGNGVLDFSKQIMENREKIKEKDMIKKAKEEINYAFSRGTFFYNDICNDSFFIDFLRNIKNFQGYRFFEILGFNTKRAEENIKIVEEVMGYDAKIFPTPHSYYGSSPQIMSFVREFARFTTMSIHLFETIDEIEFAYERGKTFEFLRTMGLYEKYTKIFNIYLLDYLNSMGMFSFKKLILVHLVHAMKKDLEYLEKIIPHAAWVLCHRSNENIGEIRKNWELLQKTPIRLLLGTDSAASSPDVSILDEIYAVYKTGFFSESMLFRAATFSAYEYLEIPQSRVPFFIFPNAKPNIESIASIKKAYLLKG